MKLFSINSLKQGLSGVLVFLFLFTFMSCDSEQGDNSVEPQSSADARKAEILKKMPEVIKNLPKIKIQKEEGKIIKDGGKDGGFTFGTSSSGFDFSNPTGSVYTTEEGVVIVSTPGFGSNAGGGVISAGSYTYTIDATFCISAGDEGEGSDLGEVFSFGGDGVSLVIGIGGDLDVVDTSEFFGGLNVLAFYVVFDDEAQGNYDVVDFFDASIGDEPDGEAYAYILDLENGILYFSASGSLNVSGGNITFDGEYFAIEFDDDFFGIDELEDFSVVNGAGTLGCP